MENRTPETSDRPRFQDRQFSSQAELHDAIARACIGADDAPTLERAVAVLADFENEAAMLEGASGWNLADENEGLEGYDREQLLDAIEGLREVLLREADETLIYRYENALLGATGGDLADSIDTALRRIGNDEKARLFFTRAVRHDSDEGDVWIEWTVKTGQRSGVCCEIAEDADADADMIAFRISGMWDPAWDDNDGLAIGIHGVDRRDGGYGEVMTVGEKKRAKGR